MPRPPGSEKRRHSRRRRRAKVSLMNGAAFTVDIGEGGFSAESTHLIAPGTRLEGVLTVDGRDYVFVGQVRWVRQGDARLGIRHRMGVQFTSVGNDFLDLLRDPNAKPK